MKYGSNFVNGLVDILFVLAISLDVLVGRVSYAASRLIGGACALMKNHLNLTAVESH